MRLKIKILWEDESLLNFNCSVSLEQLGEHVKILSEVSYELNWAIPVPIFKLQINPPSDVVPSFKGVFSNLIVSPGSQLNVTVLYW